MSFLLKEAKDGTLDSREKELPQRRNDHRTPGSDNMVVAMLVHRKQSEDYEGGSEPVEGH